MSLYYFDTFLVNFELDNELDVFAVVLHVCGIVSIVRVNRQRQCNYQYLLILSSANQMMFLLCPHSHMVICMYSK